MHVLDLIDEVSLHLHGSPYDKLLRKEALQEGTLLFDKIDWCSLLQFILLPNTNECACNLGFVYENVHQVVSVVAKQDDVVVVLLHLDLRFVCLSLVLN
jgi:hypothetical protein